MLIVSNLDRKNPSRDWAFIQRTQDMGIYLAADAAELTSEDWQAVFREAMTRDYTAGFVSQVVDFIEKPSSLCYN